MKLAYRTEQNGVHAAVRFPAPEGAVDARMVNFRTTHLIRFDRQFLPLATQIKHFQDVVEDRAQGQLRCRSAAPMREMGQDKFFELRIAQFHWNPLPLLTSRHIARQRNRILANSHDTGERHTHKGFPTNSGGGKTRNQ
jgi:hypothetical protein